MRATKRLLSRPGVRATLPLLVLAAAGVAAMVRPDDGGWGPPALLVPLAVAGVALGSYRPWRHDGLGLGAVVLPIAASQAGPASATLLACAVTLAIAAIRAAFKATPGDIERERDAASLGRVVGAVGLATLVAASIQVRWGTTEGLASLWPPAGFLAAWCSVWVLSSAGGRGRWPHPALSVDGAAWWLGLVATAAAGVAGWQRIAPLGVAAVVLAVEAARLSFLRTRAEDRIDELRRLHGAHQRILGETSSKAGVAGQILIECANVLPVHTFQVELFDPSGTRRSFAAGPDGILADGEPQPPALPPMMPGIHRRAGWRVIEKHLDMRNGAAPGEPPERLGTLRVWCDPRRVEAGAEELLTSLLPLMASSLHRARLDREAKLDTLTELPVRRVLESRMQRVYRTAYDEGKPMAVILCDIDHFKRINDTYGHDAGDQALIQVARMLDRQRRENDLCCRYGGEEFTILLEDTAGRAALALAERLRVAVETLAFSYDGQTIPLRLSAGVAAFPELHVKTGSELLLLADEALYAAKETGRNRCLLNLGRGRYRDPLGGETPATEAPSEAAVPRIFG